MLLSIGKDLLTFILEMCVEYNDYGDVNLNSLLSVLLVCKPLSIIAQKIINKNKYTYNIYQISKKRPDIIDIRDHVYTPEYIGNNIWFVSVNSASKRFIFVDEEYYSYYGGSDKYFEQNGIVIKGKINSIVTYCNYLSNMKCFTIHYKANFGEVLLLTWYDKYTEIHGHIKMKWTEGDIWVGIICDEKYTFFNRVYRYEVCIDNGGPIIRKEKAYRECNSLDLKIDVWDEPSLFF